LRVQRVVDHDNLDFGAVRQVGGLVDAGARPSRKNA
jgi:hypothetical protein